jgi:hypothetical protein
VIYMSEHACGAMSAGGVGKAYIYIYTHKRRGGSEEIDETTPSRPAAAAASLGIPGHRNTAAKSVHAVAAPFLWGNLDLRPRAFSLSVSQFPPPLVSLLPACFVSSQHRPCVVAHLALFVQVQTQSRQPAMPPAGTSFELARTCLWFFRLCGA